MKISRTETISAIKRLEEIYSVISSEEMENSNFLRYLNKISRFCIKLHPLYHDNKYFMALFNYCYQLLSNTSYFHNELNNNVEMRKLYINTRYKLLYKLEQFERTLFKQMRFHLYLHNCKMEDHLILINDKNVEATIGISNYGKLKCSNSLIKGNIQNFSVSIYSGHQHLENFYSDFYFQLESIIESGDTLITNINQLDYYKRDRLYLEAKLESLKKRQDIRLVLAGSSYTMCGLFEEKMPLPARNIAIDAQDLYYSMKSIRTALDYNPNITHCILSFAYYFWGYDLSKSTSLYQYKRVTEVNYPVFKDKHNFSSELENYASNLLKSITPLKRHLFSFEKLVEQKVEDLKKCFEDAHYFPYPREGSAVLQNDDVTNHLNAQKRASSHNKFFKYHSTVQENIELFTQFLEDMNTRGVQIILFVPPVTDFYRKYINPDLISNFYKIMEPLQSKFDFKLIDLFNSNEFFDSDFYDYDHLNDQGAEKLGKILGNELEV